MKNNHNQVFTQLYQSAGMLFLPGGLSRCRWDPAVPILLPIMFPVPLPILLPILLPIPFPIPLPVLLPIPLPIPLPVPLPVPLPRVPARVSRAPYGPSSRCCTAAACACM